MWTLTFAENQQDVTYADGCFRKTMRRFTDYFRGRGQKFHYLAVREFQSRGAIHYHVFVSQYIPIQPRPGELSMQEAWTHGYSYVVTSVRKRKNGTEYKVQHTFRASRNADALARYLSKYIVKTLDDPEAAARLEGHHLYLRSQGMDVRKATVWTTLGRIMQWAKRSGHKVRRVHKTPVKVDDKVVGYHYRLDLVPVPPPKPQVANLQT